MPKTDLLEGKRILIVDDEPDVLDTLEDLLGMCEVVKASTFEQAKDRLEREFFHMAVLSFPGRAHPRAFQHKSLALKIDH